MIARTRLAVWIAIVVWIVPALARAEARVVLSVVAPDETNARAMQSRAGSELAQRGFEVIVHVVAPDSSTLDRARELDAVIAVVVIVDERGRAEIEVIDRVTGKRLQRSLPPESAGHGPSMLALAVAELVDASLLELQLPAQTAVGEIEPPPDLPIPEPADTRVLGHAGAAVGLLWPVRRAAPVGIVIVELGLRPATRVALLAEATLPLHAIHSDVPLAEIRTLPFLVGVRTDIDVLPRRSRVRLDLQGAVNAVALRVDVDARPGARGSPQTAWTMAAVVGIALHGAVARHVHVGGGLRVVAPFDDIRIRFDGAAVQRLGPLWVGGGASVFVRW